MIVTAYIEGHVNAGARSTWTVLEEHDIEQIAWECGRQVWTFLAEARRNRNKLVFMLNLTTSPVPDEQSSTATRE